MFEKHFRRIRKPFYVRKNNERINKRKSLNPTIDFDVLLPDCREKYISDDEKIKHIGLRILNIIQKLAEIHDFEFSLAYGTLLGAIRHNGFIPWDDDIDVFMTEKDFEKFLSVSHELPMSIFLTTMDVGFFKVMDKSSIVSLDRKRGVAVDIFILKDRGQDRISFFNVHTLKSFYIEKNKYYPLIPHRFNDFQYNIPTNYNELLKGVYGDYMQMPPKDQRVSHHSDEGSISINPYGEFLVDPSNVL